MTFIAAAAAATVTAAAFTTTATTTAAAPPTSNVGPRQAYEHKDGSLSRRGREGPPRQNRVEVFM